MYDKPSREQYYSKRAKNARKHEQELRDANKRKRMEYQDYFRGYAPRQHHVDMQEEMNNDA